MAFEYICRSCVYDGLFGVQAVTRILRNFDSVPDELVNEKEKYKNIADEMDQAFSELSGF